PVDALLPLLHLVQTVAAESMPEIWVVTRGAQAVGGERVDPSQAALWGFARAIGAELPGLVRGLGDLARDATCSDGAEQLAAELFAAEREEHAAFRGGERFVARVEPLGPAPASAPLPIRADATYLVTGGLGDLGIFTARWLASEGARRLVLM